MEKQRRMTADEFEENKHKLRSLSAKTNDLARLILVDGLNNTDAAAEVGMSRQNVSKTMTRVNSLLNGMPADFVFFEGWVPGELAIEMRRRTKEALDAGKDKSKNK